MLEIVKDTHGELQKIMFTHLMKVSKNIVVDSNFCCPFIVLLNTLKLLFVLCMPHLFMSFERKNLC